MKEYQIIKQIDKQWWIKIGHVKKEGEEIVIYYSINWLARVYFWIRMWVRRIFLGE